jgi:hypothetical protein
MMVRHSTLGVGRVVAVESTAVHVFFAESEKREAAKLRLTAAQPFLHVDPSALDERLENLPAFALDPGTGRYAPEKVRATKGKKKAAK